MLAAVTGLENERQRWSQAVPSENGQQRLPSIRAQWPKSAIFPVRSWLNASRGLILGQTRCRCRGLKDRKRHMVPAPSTFFHWGVGV